MTGFNWDIPKWISRNLPKDMRDAFRLAWIKALLSPIQYLHDQFTTLNLDLDFKMRYNSQKKVLETLLNLLFDPTNTPGRIYILNESDELDPNYVYFREEPEDIDNEFDYFLEETKPSGWVQKYQYYLSEYDNNYDFAIYVPASLVYDEAQLRAQVDLRKLAGKRYIIKTF